MKVAYQLRRLSSSEPASALLVPGHRPEELLRLCGRVLVFREQHVVARLAGTGVSQDRMIAAMFGHVE